jgi:radical SAM superfamily enzyme YgiQ (UPF0313 family)
MSLFRKEMTREFLTKMKKAGCMELCWGLESGSKKMLRLMSKTNYTPDMAEEIIRTANELGYDQYSNIIIGFPGETEELFLETVQFVMRNKKYFNSIGLPIMSIRQNSPIYNNYQKYRIESPDLNDRWKTVDNSNTYELRIARRDLLSAILQEKLFDQGRYDEEKTKKAISDDDRKKEVLKPETNKRDIIIKRFNPEKNYLYKRFPRVYDYMASIYHRTQSF